MKKKNLHRVFIHELGHYVAHELNYELYGFGEIGAIEFVEHNLPNGIDYEGKTIPKIEIGQSQNDKLINLPEKIAELVYGCYFQSIFTEMPLKICLDIYNESANGYIDAQNIASGLKQFFINKQRVVLYPFLHEEYFDELKTKTNIFKSLFEVNHLDYIIKTDFGYKTDLTKLQKLTAEFRAEHKSDFKDFVERIKEIIDWKKTCNNYV